MIEIARAATYLYFVAPVDTFFVAMDQLTTIANFALGFLGY